MPSLLYLINFILLYGDLALSECSYVIVKSIMSMFIFYTHSICYGLIFTVWMGEIEKENKCTHQHKIKEKKNITRELAEIECYMKQLNSNSCAPRQPWHDLHCKIEGPAAYDILTNFEQRWRKAKKWRDFRLKKVTNWHDDALLRLDRISWIVKPSPCSNGDKSVHVTDEKDPESWNVQVWKYVDRICDVHVPLIKSSKDYELEFTFNTDI